jgi:hypothetical protein
MTGSATTNCTAKSGRKAEMDEHGIMVVDGVEFVNVIRVKARVERVDSGLGVGGVGGRADGV